MTSSKDWCNMYIRNELLKFSFICNKDSDLMKHLVNNLQGITHVYSYKLLDKGADWKVEWLVSNIEGYNTIPVKDMFDGISPEMKHKDVLVTFRQPPIELLLKLYEPLISKLSLRQVRNWRIEYEDAEQICRLTIITLHKQGYFLHKSLISRAYENEILMMLRNQLTQVDYILSADLSKDQQEEIELIADDSEDLQAIEELNTRREAVIKLIGERQYNEYLRQYNNDNIAQATRQALYRLGRKLRKE